MNTFEIYPLIPSGASATHAEFCRAFGNLLIISAEYDSIVQQLMVDGAGTTRRLANQFHFEAPFNYMLPTTNANYCYIAGDQDTNCTQIMTNLEKDQVGEGDLCVVLGTTIFANQLKNYTVVPMYTGEGAFTAAPGNVPVSYLQIGVASQTQSPTYTPFTGSLGYAVFARSGTENVRQSIESSKAMAIVNEAQAVMGFTGGYDRNKKSVVQR